jgi:hypothetical protein
MAGAKIPAKRGPEQDEQLIYRIFLRVQDQVKFVVVTRLKQVEAFGKQFLFTGEIFIDGFSGNTQRLYQFQNGDIADPIV